MDDIKLYPKSKWDITDLPDMKLEYIGISFGLENVAGWKVEMGKLVKIDEVKLVAGPPSR